MKILELHKDRLDDFVKAVTETYEFIAPVKTDETRFQAITSADQINLEEQPMYPLKRYFFTDKEILFKYNGKDIEVPEIEVPRRIFFGVRHCDLNAIKHQDMVFLDANIDPYYKARREKALFIGYHCDIAPHKFCFCNSLKLDDYSDMMFYDKGKKFIVEVQTQKGMNFVKHFHEFFLETNYKFSDNDKKIKNFKELKKPADLNEHYEDEKWEKGVKKCVSCAACTMLCPTCYCSGISDEADWDLKKMQRVRTHASCQLPSFTKVAGGHVFRKSRSDRFKHRIYHQLQWFKERHGVDLCVGCGRCITGCPTKIDFVDIINELEGEK
ncbi:4Fe-4S dicluster domain-containing protein [Nanoarchaeota archaeon]